MSPPAKKVICAAVIMAFLILAPFSMVFGNQISLITKEELKPIMNDADVAIIDVRTGRDWSTSGFKIQGAVYRDPEQIADWYTKYAKSTKIVLYCA